MSAAAPDHEHDDDQGDGHSFDWWTIADALVWASVVIVFVLGAEYLAGALVREQLARGATKLLRRHAEAPADN